MRAELHAYPCLEGDGSGSDDGLAGLWKGPAGPELAGWGEPEFNSIENGSQLERLRPGLTRQQVILAYLAHS